MKVARTRRLLASSIALIIAGTETPLISAEETLALEEIVVTARKREESLQDVPVVVQALTSDALEASGTSNFQDLNDQVSGLTIYSGGVINPSINLRGIQGDPVNLGNDEAVSINMDGIQHSNSQLFRFGLFDVETIEVLKGPQALFFGKNSPGGIVSVRSKNPTDEFFSEVRVGHEEAAKRTFGHVIVSGPLTDSWGARAGLRYEDSEGFFENTWPGAEDTGPRYDQYIFSGTLRGELESTSLNFKVYHAEQNGDGSQYNQVQLSRCNLGEAASLMNPFSDCEINDRYSAPPALPAADISRVGRDEPGFDYKLSQFGFEIEHEINDRWNFANILGYVDIDNFYYGALGPNALLHIGADNKLETISEEFRFTGDFDKTRVMVGGYVDDRTSTQRSIAILDLRSTPLAAGLPTAPDSITKIESDSWSVFGQVEYDIREDITLSVGARYSEEERVFSGRNLHDYFFPLNGGIQFNEGSLNVITPKVDYSNLSPEVSITYRPTDSITLFANYKEGFKSGGFNMSGPAVAPSNASVTVGGDVIDLPAREISYLDENVSGFEFGAKMMLLQDTLRLNTSLYSYEYENLQSPAIVPSITGAPESRTINAGIADIQGFEADLLWQTPIQALQISGNLAYNSNEYGSFVTDCNEYQLTTPGATGCNVDVDNNTATNAYGGFVGPNDVINNGGFDGQDREGHALRRAPELSGSIGANLDFELGGNLRLQAGILASYSDEYQGSEENLPWAVQDSYVLYNANIGIYDADGAWSVHLIGRNLTDEEVQLTSFDFGGSGNLEAGIPEDTATQRNNPREIILQFTFSPGMLL